MEEIKKEEGDTTSVSDEGKTSETSHKSERTEKEKAEFTLKKQAERLRELGSDPGEVLGIKPILKVKDEIRDDAPLTVGMLRELQKQDAKKTAINLADDITDEDERKDVKELLEKRLTPSGNAQADLALARAAVGAVRTAKIAEELNRKQSATRNAAGSSSPAKSEDEFTPTEAEAVMMRKPYNLSKEKILEARKRSQPQE